MPSTKELPPILLGEPMVGSDRLGYALELRGLRCVVWRDEQWQGSVDFANRTIFRVPPSSTKQGAANLVALWLVDFAKEILRRAAP